MNLNRLYDILKETACPLRKGPEIADRQQAGIAVVEIYDMRTKTT